MNVYKFLVTFLVIGSAIAFSSCEEVITLDLNTSSPHLTVTAIVTDQPGIAVKLTAVIY